MARHRSNLRAQMTGAAARARRSLHNSRVGRVLEVLSDASLTALAAAHHGAERAFTIECDDARLVWDDARVQGRLRELERQEITVERTRQTRTHSGLSFDKWLLAVTY